MTFDPLHLSQTDSASQTASRATNAVQDDPSRRTFLKTSVATTAIVGTENFLNRSVHAAGSDIIKVGLVGCGGRGMGAAKDNMSADAGCRLTAIAEVFYDRMESGKDQLRKTIGSQYEVPEEQCFSGWEALDKILQTDIDVVL